MLRRNSTLFVITLLIIGTIATLYYLQLGFVRDSGMKVVDIAGGGGLHDTVTELKIIVIGEEPKDAELVTDEVNTVLEQEYAIRIDVEYMDTSDHETAYHLLFAGGADFDLVQVKQTDVNVYVDRRAYMGLTQDMIRKTMPSFYESEDYTRAMMQQYGDIQYMIPSFGYLNDTRVAIVRGDLIRSYEMDIPSDVEDFSGYFERVMQEDGIIPLQAGNEGLELLRLFLLQQRGYELYDSLLTVYDPSVSDFVWLPGERLFKGYLSRVSSWSDGGYFGSNPIQSKRSDSFIDGETACYITTLLDAENVVRSMHLEGSDYDPVIVHLDKSNMTFTNPLSMGFAVKNGSVNAAKSLMFLEILRTDERVFGLLNYGIEDHHYLVNGNNEYLPMKDSVHYPIYNTPAWFMSNELALGYRFRIEDAKAFGDHDSEPVMTFREVEAEVYDMLSSITSNELYPMLTGQVSDTTLEDYQQKMIDSGYDDYQNGRP